VLSTLGIASQLDAEALVGGGVAVVVFGGYALWRRSVRQRPGRAQPLPASMS
jgi:hypothetical protein